MPTKRTRKVNPAPTEEVIEEVWVDGVLTPYPPTLTPTPEVQAAPAPQFIRAPAHQDSQSSKTLATPSTCEVCTSPSPPHMPHASMAPLPMTTSEVSPVSAQTAPTEGRDEPAPLPTATNPVVQRQGTRTPARENQAKRSSMPPPQAKPVQMTPIASEILATQADNRCKQ